MTLNRSRIFGLLLAALAASQLIPVDRNNPPVTAMFSAHPELMATLRRSCYDCHSNETVWPWYSRVAPVSWLIAHDVHEGREHLNFSTWGEYSVEKQAKLRKEIWQEVREGEMPPLQYYPAHPDARLSGQDKKVIQDWTGP